MTPQVPPQAPVPRAAILAMITVVGSFILFIVMLAHTFAGGAGGPIITAPSAPPLIVTIVGSPAATIEARTPTPGAVGVPPPPHLTATPTIQPSPTPHHPLPPPPP